MARSSALASNPEITVVVTTYNSEQYLQSALASLSRQTYRDFEIVVVDDGSNSRVAQHMVEGLNEKYHLSARYYYKRNGGPGSARNYGLKRAMGNYVAFLDVDDYYSADKLSIQKQMLDDLPPTYCAVIGAACHFNDRFPLRKRIVTPSAIDGDLDAALFVSGDLRVEGTPAYLFRKTALEQVGGYDEGLRVNEDFDLLLRLAAHFKLKTHPEVTFYCRKRMGSLSQSDPFNNLKHSLKFITNTEQRWPSISATVFARRRQRAYFNAALLSLRQGHFREYIWLVKRGSTEGGGVTSWRGKLALLLAHMLPCRAKAPTKFSLMDPPKQQ